MSFVVNNAAHAHHVKIIDSISRKYTGQPFPMRSPEGRVALIMEA